MPTPELARQADAVRADLARLEGDVMALLALVGGAIGSAIGDRVNEPMKAIASYLEPLLKLLGAHTASAAPTKLGPGRPPKAATAPAPRKSRRGGRGKKANLTPEAIQAALRASGGNKSAAARGLGVSQPTFYKHLRAMSPTVPMSNRRKKT